MRSLKFMLFLFTATAILTSCSKAPQDPLLQEAFMYHTEAIELEKSLQSVIGELNAKKSTIQLAGDELEETDMKFIDVTNRIEKSYERWKENRIEVPGFEHAHNHSHDCSHHHHKSSVQLTPQQMMEVQKESMKNIGDMLKKAESIL